MPTYETKPQPPSPTKVHESDGTTPVIVPVGSERYAEDLAFLEEEVEVMLSPPTGEDDTTRLVGPICVNGKCQYFIRGEFVKTRRKFLAVLLRAKTDRWTFAYKYGTDGRPIDTQFAMQSGRHYIAGLKDTNPKGAAWLQSLQQERLL